MLVKDAVALCRRLMDEHGLKDWKVVVDKTKRRAGCCKYAPKSICLSWYYLWMNADKEEDIRDTILHEIAHALTPGAKHGDRWKQVCCQIGARPIACYDVAVIAMPKGKWQATCPSCRKVFDKQRKPKYVDGMYCVRCGRENGKLQFKEVEE